jgi:DNA uptake protein ComE-like DNA-binding protein
MRLLRILLASSVIWVVTACLFMSGCTGSTPKENPEQLKEKTAQATAELKRDATAVAEGMREGWNRDKPLDLNSATKEQLSSLPGVTAVQANRVIAGRPYQEPQELVSRHIMPQSQYDKIASRITVKH